MIVLIVVLLLAFGGGGGYYGYRRWGTRRRHRDFRAGADRSGAYLCFRRIALALKQFSGVSVLERKIRRRIEWSLWID
jgi:hypothetical protein